MKTWIVSYADELYRPSLERLMESASHVGIDERRAWERDALTHTWFYAAHKGVLDERRGGGYWLWKPFIIHETLREMAEDDLLVYSDAGIAIVSNLSPLFDLCTTKIDIVLFAGHYDDVGTPGPNLCGKWTKRDAFICLECDEPRFHQARMVDASFIVLKKGPRAVSFVREWMLYCCQRHLLTDDPNVCGHPNLPEFVQHRHDQSLLSLLAARERLELFRHPSQHGNHLKLEPYRVAGEWLRDAYGSKGLYENSLYGTLLLHHRGNLRAKQQWPATACHD
jgi:hypothetical protein